MFAELMLSSWIKSYCFRKKEKPRGYTNFQKSKSCFFIYWCNYWIHRYELNFLLCPVLLCGNEILLWSFIKVTKYSVLVAPEVQMLIAIPELISLPLKFFFFPKWKWMETYRQELCQNQILGIRFLCR